MNFEWLDSVIQASPPIALALVINLMLWTTRKVPVPGWTRPVAAMVAGGAAYPFLAEAGKIAYQIRSPMLYSVIIGLCIGGLSVSLNQTVRHWIKSKTGIDPAGNGDTDEIHNPDVNGPDH